MKQHEQGAQGKGFAVVATEVRKLSKKSDIAAAEIASIINSSNQKIEDGVKLVSGAGDVLADINQAVI